MWDYLQYKNHMAIDAASKFPIWKMDRIFMYKRALTDTCGKLLSEKRSRAKPREGKARDSYKDALPFPRSMSLVGA